MTSLAALLAPYRAERTLAARLAPYRVTALPASTKVSARVVTAWTPAKGLDLAA